MSNTWVSYQKEELLTLHEHMGSHPDFFLMGFVLFIFFVLWQLLLLSLDCPFSIVASVSDKVFIVLVVWKIFTLSCDYIFFFIYLKILWYTYNKYSQLSQKILSSLYTLYIGSVSIFFFK